MDSSLLLSMIISKLVEHRTGIAEVTGSNEALIFVEGLILFRLLLSSSINWKIYCDDHSSLSSTTFPASRGSFPGVR